MNATGVVYTPGVCYEGATLSTLLGALYTYRRGYSTLFVHRDGFRRPKWERQMRIPRFLYVVSNN